MGEQHGETEGENLTGNSAMTNTEYQDRHEFDMTPGARRAARRLIVSLFVLFIVTIGLAGLNLWFTANQVNGAEQRSYAACAFWKDLSGLPLMNAANGWPSELAVSIVAHSRQAYRGFGCAGPLPPPDPSFARGAKHYGLSPD